MALNKLKKWIGTQAMTAFFDQLNDNVDATNAAIDVAESHLAESVLQGEIPHVGLGGSISYKINSGRVSTPHTKQVNASTNSFATGALSQVNASNGCTANGNSSQVETSLNCNVNSSRSKIVSSASTRNDDDYSLAGGWGATDGGILTANKKWQISSTNGAIRISGQVTPGHAFTDFAEVFPNLTGGEQGFGLLQTIDGFGVRPAQAGERIIGVTSATAGIILGDTPFSWQGRWLKGEWGAYIYETVIDEEIGEEIQVPKENPEWSSELEQQSRLERPDEWTVVGLVGQVYVRLKEDVEIMDYVKAWQGGVGQKSVEPTNVQVMKITQEYDEEKGYKVGFCLLK